MQGLGAADFADGHHGRGMADGAFFRHGERADAGINGDDLRDNLIGLDDADASARTSDAQALAFADVTQRGPLDGGTLEFYGLEDGNGRNGACGTRPFDGLQRGLRRFVLPLEGQSGTGGMMAGDRACQGIFRVVIADNETIDGEGILARGDLLGEGG